MQNAHTQTHIIIRVAGDIRTIRTTQTIQTIRTRMDLPGELENLIRTARTNKETIKTTCLLRALATDERAGKETGRINN